MHNQLTRKDIEDMEAEIEHRKIEVRQKLLQDVKTARAHGDLSENFEYYAAKREKNKNESRIRYLERMVRTAEIIEDQAGADEAGVNKTVTVRVEEDGTQETYRIVTTIRGDSLQGLISIESPVGKALLRHKTGDRVTIRVSPEYSYDVTILSVRETSAEEDAPLRSF